MWLLLLMLSSGGYNISSVNRAISEYRIQNTHGGYIFSVCTRGLDITSRAVTSHVRKIRPCGISPLCLLTKNGSISLVPILQVNINMI